MIDFTNSKEVICNYSGSEKKKKIIYNDEFYLLKFPDPIRQKNKQISYINNVFSEYIGCKIFKSLDIPVQEVILGKYKEPDESNSCLKEKTVVACKDFTDEKKFLIEFSSLANSITSSDKHFTTDIADVYSVLNIVSFIYNKKTITDNFWDMFVVDTLIGNVDRHLSNWGLLVSNDQNTFAPIYDCGSSLHPLMSDDEMEKYLNNPAEFKEKVYSLYPVYKYNGEKLTYRQFYDKNIKDLNEALIRIMPRIDMKKINSIIDIIEPMSKIRKEFLKKSIQYRKEHILDKAYQNLTKNKNKL